MQVPSPQRTETSWHQAWGAGSAGREVGAFLGHGMAGKTSLAHSPLPIHAGWVSRTFLDVF